MYMGDKEICSISMADNGFIVKFKDVKGEEAARKARRESRGDGPYIESPDPEVVVAPTTGKLMSLLRKRVPELINESEQFDEAFKEASKGVKSKF